MVSLKGKKGIALIMAMWIMTILVMVAASFAFMMRTEVKMATNFRNEIQAHYLARAGVEKAIAALCNDSAAATDDRTEDWYTSTTGAGEITLGRGIYTVIVEDESGKINLNNADNESLQGLFDVGSATADEIIDYTKGFDTIRELVKCPEVAMGIWDGNSTYDSTTYWNKDGITVYTTPFGTDDQININTAPWYGLRGLSDGDGGTGLSDPEIRDIRNYVYANPLETITAPNLEAISNINSDEATDLAAGNQLKVTSEGFFRIISIGEVRDASGTTIAQRKIEAVIDRTTNPIDILYWTERAFAD